MNKLLICFLYWEKDRIQVEKVSRLCADLLPEFAENAEVMLVGRYDAPPPSSSIQIALQQKFSKVHVWKCNRKGEGFPGGCNELGYGTLNYVLTQRHMGLGFKDIEALLILESDCVFLRPTYIEEILELWKNRNPKTCIMGTRQEGREEWHTNDHINAAAIYDPEISRKCPFLIGGPMHIGWDNYHGPALMPFAEDSKLFKLDYQRPTITSKELFADEKVLMYHGVKDNSAIEAVREKFNLDKK